MSEDHFLEDKILSILKTHLSSNFNYKKIIQKIEVLEDKISVILEVNKDQISEISDLKKTIIYELERSFIKRKINILISSHTEKNKKENINPKKNPNNIEKFDTSNIKKIIAIGSGKGGVGKSTVSANLALSLKKIGKKVGLLDADLYGPSQPKIFDIKEPLQTIKKDQKELIIPMKKFGISLMSIGFMIGEEDALIWRGPMLIKALKQFVNQVEWEDIDVLIVDLPPGTGDIQLTLSQKFKLDGAVIVSTPQDLALLDAKKAIKMFQKLDIPVLGLIENMSYHRCSNCGYEEKIFGSNGVLQEARKKNIPYLGEIPLEKKIRVSADKGLPFSEFNEKEETQHFFSDIAKKLIINLV